MDANTTWKIVGVTFYLAVLLGIGAAASRRMRNLADYFAGGKRFGFWAAAFSARATGESAWLLLGLTGMGALVGVKALFIVLGEVLFVSLAWLGMGARFKRLTDRYDAITIPDYLEARFRDGSHTLRRISAFALVVFVTIYVSAQIDATGSAFEIFLGLDYYAGALLGFAVVMAYVVSGGFVAVVWSDVFQGLLMFLGLVGLPVVAFLRAGGLFEVGRGLLQIDPALLSFSGGKGWTPETVAQAIGFVGIGLGFLGSPQIFVRFLAIESPGEVKPGAVVAFVWTLFADTGAVLTGLVGRHLLTRPGQPVEAVLGSGAQGVLPQLAELVLPAALVGMMIAVVLAAIMSTVDSLLVLASSALVRDWYQKVRHPHTPDEALVPLSRRATAGLALAALALALAVAVTTPERTIFWFVIFGWSGIAATFCPTMVLSLFWSGITPRGAGASMVLGFAAVPFFKFVGPGLPGVGPVLGALGELPPAFVVALAAGVLVSALDNWGQHQVAGVASELRAAAGASGPGDWGPSPSA